MDRRPTFSIQLSTDLDKTLLEVSQFAGRIASFGEADGFFKILVDEGYCWEVGLDPSWKHNPPHFFEYVSPQGTVYPYDFIQKELREDWQRKYDLGESMRRKDEEEGTDKWISAIREGDPRLISRDEDNNTLYWIIDARACLVSMDSFFKVGHGFHTRVVSPSFELAFKRTRELWEKESAKEDWEKENKDPPGYDVTSYRLSQCIESESLQSIISDLEYRHCSKAIRDTFNPENLTIKQWWDLYELVEDLKSDTREVSKLVKDHVGEENFKKFQEFRKQEFKIEKEMYSSRRESGGEVRMRDFFESLDNTKVERLDKFLKSLEKGKRDE